MNKTTTTSASSVQTAFIESSHLQKDIEKLITSETLSDKELTVLEDKLDGLIGTLEDLKEAING